MLVDNKAKTIMLTPVKKINRKIEKIAESSIFFVRNQTDEKEVYNQKADREMKYIRGQMIDIKA